MAVNRVRPERLPERRQEEVAHAGLEVGEDSLPCVLRRAGDDFERPWRCRNPADSALLGQVLQRVGQGRRPVVAPEPTGTYGGAPRQALGQAGLAVHRVSPKACAGYAESFGGVPAQHGGKDAAVVAELAARGRGWPRPPVVPGALEQGPACRVDGPGGRRRQTQLWYGRPGALLSRPGPEATALPPLNSGVLRRCPARYGGPRGLAEDPQAAERLCRWGKGLLRRDKAQALAARARQAAGVPPGRRDGDRLRRYARGVQNGLGQQRQARRRSRQLAPERPIIRALGGVAGPVTACVPRVEVGNPPDYHRGAAYRQAVGLDLQERSSGRRQGRRKTTQRGPGAARRWLSLAAPRRVRHEPVRSRYLRRKAQRRGDAKPAAVGVMRKLPPALYRAAGRGEPFGAQRLHRSLTATGTRPAE